ncbi:MAG: hypothetical protein ACK6CE_01535, partial [Planctomycetota bacterium]
GWLDLTARFPSKEPNCFSGKRPIGPAKTGLNWEFGSQFVLWFPFFRFPILVYEQRISRE